MKWFKRIVLSSLGLAFIFFAFYEKREINLEGIWKTKTIILNGQKIYPDTIAKFINFSPEIIIDGWTNSISVPIDRKNVHANLEYIQTKKGKFKMKLFSSQKALNGIFDVKIDTSNIQPKSYTVDVELKSHKTLISFKKNVIITPWNPGRHRKGTPY